MIFCTWLGGDDVGDDINNTGSVLGSDLLFLDDVESHFSKKCTIFRFEHSFRSFLIYRKVTNLFSQLFMTAENKLQKVFFWNELKLANELKRFEQTAKIDGRPWTDWWQLMRNAEYRLEWASEWTNWRMNNWRLHEAQLFYYCLFGIAFKFPVSNWLNWIDRPILIGYNEFL